MHADEIVASIKCTVCRNEQKDNINEFNWNTLRSSTLSSNNRLSYKWKKKELETGKKKMLEGVLIAFLN